MIEILNGIGIGVIGHSQGTQNQLEERFFEYRPGGRIPHLVATSNEVGEDSLVGLLLRWLSPGIGCICVCRLSFSLPGLPLSFPFTTPSFSFVTPGRWPILVLRFCRPLQWQILSKLSSAEPTAKKTNIKIKSSSQTRSTRKTWSALHK